MKWEKKGLIVKPRKLTWMVSHAQNPFARYIKDSVYRIYFAGRDKFNRAHGGWTDVDIDNPQRQMGMSREPILKLGDLGCFDDSGVMPSCIVEYDGKEYMYYTGWSQCVATPFSFFIGLAISEDGGKTYTRYSKAPVLGRSKSDPYLTCSPWVVIEDGLWRMWYVCGTGWTVSQNDIKPKHYYHIRYAESSNGLEWKREGIICIDYRDDEYAIARPVVYKDGNLYKMVYCYRGGYETYRAGYAQSHDGIEWVRKDNEAGIDVSEIGWDSEMICYPFVSSYNGKEFMLYNGNAFGRDGIGLAFSME